MLSPWQSATRRWVTEVTAATQTPPPVVQSALKATVEVPAPVVNPWYKPLGEAAGAITALFAVLGYMAWVVSRIINADRDIKELKHDLRGAEQKIVALDGKREDAARELAVLKNTTQNLENMMTETKDMMKQVLDAVTKSRR